MGYEAIGGLIPQLVVTQTARPDTTVKSIKQKIQSIEEGIENCNKYSHSGGCYSGDDYLKLAEMYRQTGNLKSVADTYARAASVYAGAGGGKDAARVYIMAADVYKKLADRAAESNALCLALINYKTELTHTRDDMDMQRAAGNLLLRIYILPPENMDINGVYLKYGDKFFAVHSSQAAKLNAAGKCEDAIEEYQKISDFSDYLSSTKKEEFYTVLSSMYLDQGQKEEAGLVYVQAALKYLKIGRFAEAKQQFSRAGDAYKLAGQYSTAKGYYEEALSLCEDYGRDIRLKMADNDIAEYLNNPEARKKKYYAKNVLDIARDYSRVLSREPENAELWLRIGWMAYIIDQKVGITDIGEGDALSYWSKAVAMQPDMLDRFPALWVIPREFADDVNSSFKNTDAKKNEIKQDIRDYIKEEGAYFRNELIRDYIDLGWRQLQENDPASAARTVARLKQLLSDNKKSGAVSELEALEKKTKELEGKAPDPVNIKGRIYSAAADILQRSSEDYQLAIEYYNEASYRGYTYGVEEKKGDIYSRLNNRQEAADSYRAALTDQTNKGQAGRVWQKLGDLSYKLNDIKQYTSDYTDYCVPNTKNMNDDVIAAAMIKLGELQERHSYVQKAAKVYKLVALNGGVHKYLSYLERAAVYLPYDAEIFGALGRHYSWKDPSRAMTAYFKVAQIMLDKGQQQKAITAYEEAVKFCKPGSRPVFAAHDKIAAIYEKQAEQALLNKGNKHDEYFYKDIAMVCKKAGDARIRYFIAQKVKAQDVTAANKDYQLVARCYLRADKISGYSYDRQDHIFEKKLYMARAYLAAAEPERALGLLRDIVGEVDVLSNTAQKDNKYENNQNELAAAYFLMGQYYYQEAVKAPGFETNKNTNQNYLEARQYWKKALQLGYKCVDDVMDDIPEVEKMTLGVEIKEPDPYHYEPVKEMTYTQTPWAPVDKTWRICAELFGFSWSADKVNIQKPAIAGYEQEPVDVAKSLTYDIAASVLIHRKVKLGVGYQFPILEKNISGSPFVFAEATVWGLLIGQPHYWFYPRVSLGVSAGWQQYRDAQTKENWGSATVVTPYIKLQPLAEIMDEGEKWFDFRAPKIFDLLTVSAGCSYTRIHAADNIKISPKGFDLMLKANIFSLGF